MVMFLEENNGDWKTPAEAAEGALPKEAGVNFTWDSVQLNLRSVFGQRGAGGEEREVEGRDSIGIRGREGVETEQYVRRSEGRSEIWKEWTEEN